MRLIDADALLEQMKHRKDYVGRQSDAVCIVEDAPTVGGWISVKDRTPEEGEEVLVVFRWNGEHELYVSYDRWQYGSWRDILSPFDEPWFEKKVLYWMPTPEPPKEDTDGRVD